MPTKGSRRGAVVVDPGKTRHNLLRETRWQRLRSEGRVRRPKRSAELPPAIEYLCREYAKVVRAIWERERREGEQGSLDE